MPGRSGYFFVGGDYEGDVGDRVMTGQMYVSYTVPRTVRAPYPIVMIHGGGQTGTNFEGTPDGRAGWADFFVAQGYAVYVVDQPARGRSSSGRTSEEPHHLTAEYVERHHTAPEVFRDWPEAELHTQWPGGGRIGDAVFDRHYASGVPFFSGPEVATANQAAGAALLDRIGPAVLLTHSQSGVYGWLIADARPNLVKAIVAVEPSGPPVFHIEWAGPAEERRVLAMERPWGIAPIPIGYAPPLRDATELRFSRQEIPDQPDLVRCWLQEEPARQLVNLAGIPILLLTGEASYHAAYDHCTSRYLRQAGVDHDFVRLAEVGIRGNGHMMMVEKNNRKIARFMHDWLKRRLQL